MLRASAPLVIEGAVTVHDGGYGHDGHPVSGERAQALVRLHAASCLAVGAPVPAGTVRCATVAGASRFGELRARHC